MSKWLNSIIFLLLYMLLFNSKAQIDSTIVTEAKQSSLLKKSVLPSALFVAGVAFNNSQFEKKLAKNVRNSVGHDFQLKIDDYIQYLPMVEIYAADMMKLKSKNHWFGQTKYLALSQLSTAIVVHTIKFGLNKTRPNGTDHSFPSGHTSQVMVGATVLYHEFKDTHPVLAYSGYLFAATTGTFRIINNRHWFSDVVAGAGIGLMMTNLVYHYEPLKKITWNKKNTSTTFLPYYNGNEVGVFYTLQF